MSRSFSSRIGRPARLALLSLGPACAVVLAAATQLGARVPPTALDAAQLSADPALYAAARSYFPTDEASLPQRRIFRLTRDQIDATVSALLPKAFDKSVKSVMARDPLQTNYEFADLLAINAANHGSLSGWIGEIAARVRANPGMVVDCKAKADAPECLETAARAFVTKAFRADASPAQVDRIVKFYLDGVKGAGLAQATSELVEVVLNSPAFLFRKEVAVDPEHRLAPQQLLQVLTYTLADSPPDRLGLDSRQAESLLATPDKARATIAAILATKEAREKLTRFFLAWLEVREPGEFTISEQVFPEFNAKLAEAMREETRRFLDAKLATPAPRLKDITQASETFLSKPLEAVYGAKAKDAAGASPTALDPAQRLGIFTQPAVIASHSGPTGTRLIKRGVFWVRKVMCMEMETPSKEVLDEVEKIHAPLLTTERKRMEELNKPRVCTGCHKVIDPFGFFQENYDAIGRWRAKDNGHPVDAAATFDFLDEGQAKTATPVEALRTLTSSMMFKQCFVRQVFRFYMGRQEEAADDPLLRRMFFDFARGDGQAILPLVEALAMSDRVAKRE